MKVGIVAPSPVPFAPGGAERVWSGLAGAIGDHTSHDVELVKLDVREQTLVDLIDGYRAFAALDVGHFDVVITSKYPAWIVAHPRHVVWMFHPLRGLYDTYHVFRLPTSADPIVDEVRDLVRFARRSPVRAELDAFFATWDRALAAAGPAHPDLALPSPVARTVVQWLDAVALAPTAVHRHVALSTTVAGRAGYFPSGVGPAVAHAPSDLPTRPKGNATHLFTTSRLDAVKRIDLLVRAMADVPGARPLLIGGAGPYAGELAELAAGDDRIRFLGFIDDADLPDLYADALAVPFVPADEDYGLIAVEAMSCGAPVLTCVDSGGPTELVVDGVSGLVTAPTAHAVAAGLRRLVRDPEAAARMGRAGRRRAGEITWKAVVATLLEGLAPAPSSSVSRPAPAVEPAPPRAAVRVRRGRARVVVLSTFGVAEPRHGGQLRVTHLYGALARHVDVEILSLVDREGEAGTRTLAPGLTEIATARSRAHLAAGERLSAQAAMPVTDLVAGTHVRETPAFLARLRDAAAGADAVLLAEPYLLPAVEALHLDRPLVYDAFNVEADLKASALPASAVRHRLLTEVQDVERRAVLTAGAVTTCSAEDARRLAATYGRPVTDFAVVPNGTDCSVPVPSAEQRRRHRDAWLDNWTRAHPRRGRRRHLAVFFASWHPPNLDAAEILLWLAPQLPDVQFVLGGSHGDAFADRVPPDNLIFTGAVSHRAKATLLGAADVALNPMLFGSGTNLKVIEYLAAGVPVVSTPFGVRGLEVTGGVHLLVAEPHHMVSAIASVLADPASAADRADAGRRLARERYDWRALGDRLAHVVRRVVAADERGAGATVG